MAPTAPAAPAAPELQFQPGGTVPSGNLTIFNGKSPFLMGKSTINNHFQ